MIGYSLGGLIVRYAIGILGREGFFDAIEPIVRKHASVLDEKEHTVSNDKRLANLVICCFRCTAPGCSPSSGISIRCNI